MPWVLWHFYLVLQERCCHRHLQQLKIKPLVMKPMSRTRGATAGRRLEYAMAPFALHSVVIITCESHVAAQGKKIKKRLHLPALSQQEAS